MTRKPASADAASRFSWNAPTDDPRASTSGAEARTARPGRRASPCHGPMLGALILALSACAAPQRERVRPASADGFTERLALLAITEQLHASLLIATSATAALEDWCRDHELARPARVAARRLPVPPRPADRDQRMRLQVGDDTPLGYRRVELRCGERVLSEAENWYVPERLTGDMNRLLDGSDTPFGKVIKPLQPYRRTFSAQMMWSPLPAGWEQSMATADPSREAPVGAIPDRLFEHRAVVYAADHRPIAEVHEVYRRDNLAFWQGIKRVAPRP